MNEAGIRPTAKPGCSGGLADSAPEMVAGQTVGDRLVGSPRRAAKRRHLVIGVLFATYFLSYLDRAVMATAIPFISREFALSSFAAGLVLSAFFLGYALMQIPAGIMADRFSPARILVVSILAWSVFTAATGLVHSLAAMIVLRILFGLSEGPAPPAISKTIATRFRRDQVGRTNGTVIAATLVGSALAPGFVAAMVIAWGWRSAFFSMLVPGLALALVAYLTLCRDDGRGDHDTAHPSSVAIGDEGSSFPEAASTDAGGGWRNLASSRGLRWCIVTVFLANVANWGLMNWLPTYLLDARGFSVARMGLFASAPFAAGAVGYVLSGYIGDRFFSQKRHVPAIWCLLAAAVGTCAATLAPTGELSVLFMTVSFFLLNMAMAVLFTLPLVLVPQEVTGSAFGIVNTGAQIAGFLSPLAIGLVLDASGRNFAVALFLIVAVLALAAIAAARIGRERRP